MNKENLAMTICNNTMSFRPVRLLATGLLLLVCTLAYSQTIIIGGDIYGGGREGAVGTAKTQNATISKDSVVLKDGALTGNTTNITSDDYCLRICQSAN